MIDNRANAGGTWKRKDFLGNDKLTITGVRTAGNRLPNLKATANTVVHCQLCRDADEEPGDEDDIKPDPAEPGAEDLAISNDPIIKCASDLPMVTGLWRGWRTSYRKYNPEAPDRIGTYNRLKRKCKAFEDLLTPEALLTTQRHISQMPLEMKDSISRKRKAIRKAETAAMRLE